jgi:AraC family transcriptional regulator
MTTPPNPLSSAFRQAAAQPALRVLQRANLLVTEIRSDHRDVVVAGTVPRDDAYVVTLHLRERPKGAMSAEGRWLQTRNFHAGHAGIVDLRLKLTSEYAGAFHYLSFYVRRQALADVAEDAGPQRFPELRHEPGVGFSDSVLYHLLSSLRPALAADPAETSLLYADHVATAFVSYLAGAYGELSALQMPRGGLALWQRRRVEELLDARLDGTVRLAELAGECQLSVRHFTRAFRESMGQPPHRWLTARRLERAQQLLERSARSLSQIAFDCGFASQSHFTRVFTRSRGVSPGVWRRQRRT